MFVTHKKIGALLAITLLSTLTSTIVAHDFWLETKPGSVPSSRPFIIEFNVGHKDDIGDWPLIWNRIVALRAYHDDGITDLASSIGEYSPVNRSSLVIEGLADGTHIIGLESYHSYSKLSADRFNNYVENEGLIAIAKHRKKTQTEGQPGIEIYSRKAKTIVQIGDKQTLNVTKPIGHSLEIVPLSHPNKHSTQEPLKIKVLFRGRPLAEATIDVVNISNKETETVVKSDMNGQALISFKDIGTYKLNVVWGTATASHHTDADFETYFSSLTFAIKADSD